MGNPLFNSNQQMQGGPAPAPTNGLQAVIQRFQQFQQMFRGDPRQQVQNLLNSGRVSQQQYDNAVQMANQLQRLMGGK